MLVASDGVRSAVQRRRMPGASLNYLGVVLITGFTALRHPLLTNRGFYTLDGKRARSSRCRLPPESPDDSDDSSARDDGNETSSMKRGANDERVSSKSMWQISVRVTEAEARALARAPRATASDFDARADPFSSVRAFVFAVAGAWHDPVPAMFKETDWEEVWCGPLYDRDEPPRPKTGADATSRVTAVGDAAHPMSPFKGMGANTALFDAWHLARWLLAPVPRAIACFEREMFTAPGAVRASREACVTFHPPPRLTRRRASLAGAAPELVPSCLKTPARPASAPLGARLEAETAQALREFRSLSLGLSADERVKPYAYRKAKQGDDAATRRTKRSRRVREGMRMTFRNASGADPSRAVPLGRLASRVEAAFHEAVRLLGAPPLTADEAEVARWPVPAAARGRLGRRRPDQPLR